MRELVTSLRRRMIVAKCSQTQVASLLLIRSKFKLINDMMSRLIFSI